ncbi:MAG: hypothetical protein FWG66_11060 [Spirochaetes bacterium]|nr:hypothetical protein [Spirochaetota bacterium]
MNDLFLMTESGAETGTMSEEQLAKALAAGTGTDSAQFVGGRSMVPESLEATMVNAMREQKDDCKLMNRIKRRPVRSTVHEYTRRYDVGDHDHVTVGEGQGSPNTRQDLRRIPVSVKFLQTRRSITDQMLAVESLEDAYESEKMAGTLTILRASEMLCFHGDSDVVPTEWDGLPKQIMRLPREQRNVKDYRGRTIASIGERVLTDTMQAIADDGGHANISFFPLVLTRDLQDLVRDRIIFGTGDSRMSPVMESYPSPFGTLKIGGDVGMNRLFRVKGRVSENGDPDMRPNAPAALSVNVSAESGSQFFAADGGNYRYTVHAVNQYGISPGRELGSPVAVGSGEAVRLTIKADASKPGTGFVICRSAKNGEEAMEMIRIGGGDGTTTFTDLNEELPGTASILFLTEQRLQTVVEFYQLLPLRMRPLFESNRAEKPFFIQLFGAPDLKVPRWCGLANNIAYSGGFEY